MGKFAFGLIIILITAAILRFWQLGSLPAGIHYSEALVGWRAQNLISFGRDEFGRSFPLIFSSGQELELPLTTYLSIPFVALSPTNPFFLRLPFAIIGVFGVLGAVFLTRRLFPEKKHLDLFVGLVFAVNPWGVWLSRVVSHEILAFTLIIWGVYFLLDRNRMAYLGAFLLILALLSSKVSIFLIPGLLLVLFFYQVKVKVLVPVLFGWIAVLFLLFTTLDGFLDIKTNDFSLFNEVGYTNSINTLRGNEIYGGNPILGKLFFNKSFYLVKILDNFLSQLDPSYIFARGDTNSLHGISNFGPILLVFFPFFIYGVWTVCNSRFQKNTFLILSWLILATLPALFLVHPLQTNKFLLALYPLGLIIGLGLQKVGRLVFLFFLVFLSFNILFVGYDVIGKEASRSDKIWQPLTLELAEYLKTQEYDSVWVTNALDPNPGPVFSYLYQTPYFKTNLASSKGRIFKVWISQIDNMRIVGSVSTYEDFDLLVATKSESEQFLCVQEINQIGEGETKYYIYSVLEECDNEI